MKKLILFTSVVFLLAGCKQTQAPASEQAKDEKAKENIALIRDLFKTFEDENLEGMKGFYSDSVVAYGPSVNIQEGFEEMVQGMAEFFEEVDSLKFDFIHIMAETTEEGDIAGDWVLQWSNVSWYDIKAERKIMLMYHSAEMIKDGKIIIEANYWNQWDLYKQLGAELTWPDEK